MSSTVSQADPSKNLNQFNKFLENNIDFLKEKYTQHFVQPFLFTQLQTKSKIQIGIKFIYDVFSFEKYQKDEKMNLTLRKSLRQNILTFLKAQLNKQSSIKQQSIKQSTKQQSNKQQSNKQVRLFQAQDGIKLLKYCIQNNEMFAVHYDKKEKKSQVLKQQNKIQQNNESQQRQLLQKQDENINQKQQNRNEQQQQNKIQLNLSQISKKSILVKQSNLQPKQNKQNNSLINNNKIQEEKIHNQTLKKQAKVIFQFYCKQQLNTGGPNSTFDKILHQANTMTLGKFIAFANTSRILFTTKIQANKPKGHKILDKKTINQLFKKIGKAQKQIDFDQFFALIKAMNQVDNTVYDKLNMDKAQTSNKIVRKLKYLNTPFNMKGYLQQDSTQFVIDQKPYIPINTAHSGRFQTSLKQDIEQRRQKLRLLPYQPYPNPNQIKPHDTFLIQSNMRQSFIEQQLMESKIKGPNGFLLHRKGQSKTTMDDKKQGSKIRLQNSRISLENNQQFRDQINVLKGLIVHDDDNDDLFLKDYKIPKLGSNVGLKKKTNNLSISNRNSEDGRQSGRKFSGMKSQRKNVVDELKQRIIQVQKNERKQMTGIQNKRRSISSINNNY